MVDIQPGQNGQNVLHLVEVGDNIEREVVQILHHSTEGRGAFILGRVRNGRIVNKRVVLLTLVGVHFRGHSQR